MSSTAVVIPVDPAQPLRTITWSAGELPSLYEAIDCTTVYPFTLHIDGAGPTDRVTVWVDDDGRYATNGMPNRRLSRLAAGLGQPIVPLFGTAVVTGDADENGATLGLDPDTVTALRDALGAQEAAS